MICAVGLMIIMIFGVSAGEKEVQASPPAEEAAPDADRSGPIYDLIVGPNTECLVNIQCGGSTPICYNRKCVSCTQSSECSNGSKCINNKCGCSSDGDCGGSTPACAPSRCPYISILYVLSCYRIELNTV